MSVFSSKNYVRATLATNFRDAAAIAGGTDLAMAMRPVAELAADQSVAAKLDVGRNEMYHLVENWHAVCDSLDARESGAAGEARRLLASLKAAQLRRGPKPSASAFFEVVLCAWDVIGTNGCAYSCMMDIVEIADEWPDDPSARHALERAVGSAAR